LAEEKAQNEEATPAGAKKTGQESLRGSDNDRARKLDAAGWGLFLIWLGIVLLVKAQTSVALLGVGIIMVAVQLARLAMKLSLQGFWFVVGLLFVLGSLWQLVDTRIPVVPILLIAAGLALVLIRFLPRHRK